MSAEYSHFGMSIALGRPEQCHEEVTRAGEIEPCDKVAVALRLDPHESEPYPVCSHHARGDMVSLEEIVRFMLERHNTQEVVARKLVQMASGSSEPSPAPGTL